MAFAKELREIERWLKKSGWKESRLGLLATGNQRAVARIRDGSARISTLESVLTYIRDSGTVRPTSTRRRTPKAR